MDGLSIQVEEQEQLTQDPDFWNDPKSAEEQLREIARLKSWVLAYNEAFACLEREDAKAKDMFVQLKAQYPDDPLVNLHYERIMSGTLSTTIVLAEK